MTTTGIDRPELLREVNKVFARAPHRPGAGLRVAAPHVSSIAS